MTPSRIAENEALIEIRSALQAEKLRDAADRAEHARRFGPPVFAWVKDERNGRMRRVQLPFAAEPDLAELILKLTRRLEMLWDQYGYPYFIPDDAGLLICEQTRDVLKAYPLRCAYHAHGLAVSLGGLYHSVYFRPYNP